VVEGGLEIAPGQRSFTIRDLRPLGIEAYGHAPAAERHAVARRVWSRGVYCTFSPAARPS